MNNDNKISIYKIPTNTTNVEYYDANSHLISVLHENYTDDYINQMTPFEIFEEALNYEGLCGFGETISDILNDVFEIDLHEISDIKKENNYDY